MSLNIEINAAVECYSIVEENEDYVGEIYTDVVGENKQKAIEVREVTLQEEGPNPNLDFIKCYDTIHDFRAYDAREKIKAESDEYAYTDLEVVDISVEVSGDRDDWREQVESWASERPSVENAENVLNEYDSWNQYEWVSVDVPVHLGMDYSLPYKDEEQLADEAYNRGYDQYENTEIARETDSIDELEPEILEGIPPTDYADWANNKAPSLRHLAGCLDSGHKTYQVGRDIVLTRQNGKKDEISSHRLYDGVFGAYRRGCLDAIAGNDRDSEGRLGR